MKNILVMVLFLACFGIKADCVEKLLNGYSLDSQAFSFYNSDISEMLDSQAESGARAAIEALTAKLECDREDLSVQVKEVSCQELQAGKLFSQNCYVETHYGYFFVSVDMMEKVHLIYNRFD